MNENTPLIDSPTPSEDAYEADASEVGEQEGQKTHISRTFFLIAQLGIFLALADDSFVLATHGRIASQFNQLGASHWLITGYSLGYTVFLPTFGRLYDVYGAKLPLVAAYLLFAVGCTITGTSFSMGLAVFGRVLAGIGGSGMVDLISVLIADSLPIKEVAILRSYIGIVSTIGLGSGPSLGGTITTLVGWRWAFLCHVPFVLLCLGMTIWYLPSGKYSKHQPTSSTSAGHHRPSFDFPGIVLLGGTIAMFILICRVVAEGVYSARLVYVLLAIKSVFLILFLLNEGLWAKDPLVPFELVKSNGIGIACIVQVLNLSALYCLLSNIGEFFVRTEDATESLVGVYMIPAGMGFALGATPCGYLIKRTGRYKSLSIIFLCMAMLGYFLVALRWPHGPSHWELVYTVLCSTGNGGFLATQFVSFTALTPTGSSATAMTMYYISQQVGMIFGATVGATLSRAFLKYGLIRKMGTDTVVLQIIDKILRNNRFAYSLPENVQNIVQSVYMKSFGIVPVSSLSFIALSLPLVLLIRERNIN